MLFAMRRVSSLVERVNQLRPIRRNCILPYINLRSLTVGRLIMRKAAIAFISVVVLLLSGFVWNAEAYCPYPRCVIRPPSARLRAVCVRVEGVPPSPCPMSHGQGTCCKQYGKWHCPCP